MQSLQASFAEFLKRELGQMARLELVLGQENEALKQRDTDALVKCSQEKQSLVTDIEAASRERLALLEGAGRGTDKEALHAFLDTDHSGELRRLWGELEALLLRCQRQNQVNGMVLERDKQLTQQLLGLLLGEGRTKETELYDASGSTSSSFLNGRSVKV